MCQMASEVKGVASEIYLNVARLILIEKHLKECAGCNELYKQTRETAEREHKVNLSNYLRPKSFAAATGT